MALTMADFSRLATQPLRKAVIDIFRKESMVMDILPWEDAGTLSIEIPRVKDAPVPAWRKINADFSESKAVTETIQERVFDLGGFVDVDKMYVRAKNTIVNMRAFQTDQFVTAMAYEFNSKFISGNPLVDEDTFVGLWYRLKNLLPSAQTITNSTGLDISPDASGLAANFDTFFDKTDELIHALADHKAAYLAMNSTAFLRFQSGLRARGLLSQNADQFGRRVYEYGPGGPQLIDLGNTTPGGTTKIIGNVELADGTAVTGGASTSIYAFKTGEGKYLTGFYEYPMDTVDLGLINNGRSYRTVIDWPVGIFHVSPFAVARMVGVIAA